MQNDKRFSPRYLISIAAMTTGTKAATKYTSSLASSRFPLLPSSRLKKQIGPFQDHHLMKEKRNHNR